MGKFSGDWKPFLKMKPLIERSRHALALPGSQRAPKPAPTVRPDFAERPLKPAWQCAPQRPVDRPLSRGRFQPIAAIHGVVRWRANIWQFMRQNWLSNRIFKPFDDIVDHCCYAWNTLIDQPWKIMSIARRDWTAAGHSI